MSRRAPALILSAAALLAATVMLTGCRTPEPAPTTPAPSPSESATPSAEPSPTDAPPSSTPVDIPCSELVTAQAMYDFNPNFSLLDSWTPNPGSAAADALAADGVACRWKNDTNGEVIDVSVASFDSATLDELASSTYSHSTMVPTYGGDEAYFEVTDNVGEAVVFDGSYWVVATSSYFLEPGDAEPIVAAALSAL